MYDPVIILGFKFLKVIIESIHVHKHRIDARYHLSSEWHFILHKREKPIDAGVQKQETFPVSDHLSPFRSQASSWEFLRTCMCGRNLYIFLIESLQVWCPQEPLEEQLRYFLSFTAGYYMGTYGWLGDFLHSEQNLDQTLPWGGASQSEMRLDF